ncbi:MAG: hypothetical protein H0U44_02575 [Flavisolibacter sp.]|jgi:hypothetical protein|nr:hypothetical protein [Flavisolibacter sp.]
MLHSTKPRIVVAGYIICGPMGGMVWHHLQYVLGLQQLGYDILFVEDSHDYAACYNPITFQLTIDPSYGLDFLQGVFEKYNLKNKWAYFDYHSNTWLGKSKKEVENFISNADIFINLSGVDPLREHFQKIPLRVFIDTDPAFTQIRHLTDKHAMDIAKKHNRFFSFGENFGQADCLIPDDGFAWLPTRQPVVMNAWSNSSVANKNNKWTTVMQWDSYKIRAFNGEKFGMKSSSFDAFIDLPKKSLEIFELALGSTTAPRPKLIAEGWHVIDPFSISLTPESYQAYILESKGEWSVAKHGYVVSKSGWFSERSCSYLASGRPVIVQDTGFSKLLQTGHGLFSFSSIDESLAAIETINHDYQGHCKSARAIAEEYFDAKTVLQTLLTRL